MASVTELIKELRERTGAGMMECKGALLEANNDLDKAIEILRAKGLAKAAKKAGRDASEGLVASYIHGEGRVGVLVEVNCETDFVARTEDFKNLCRELAMQIAATNPLAVRGDDVPAAVVERERRIYREQAEQEGKPANVIDKVVDGKVKKFLKEQALLEQEYIRNPDITVQQLVTEAVAKLGENIVVKRFMRFALGEA